MEIGERAAKEGLKINIKEESIYIILGNIYCSLGMKFHAKKIQQKMNFLKLKKIPSLTIFSKNGISHEFHTNEKNHFFMKEILIKLKELYEKLVKTGFKPDTSFILDQDLTDLEKTEKLGFHSEKISLCFALLNTEVSEKIILTNNLKMCGDCHNFFKEISKLLKKEIRVYDTRCWHHFEKNGFCSCGGFY